MPALPRRPGRRPTHPVKLSFCVSFDEDRDADLLALLRQTPPRGRARLVRTALRLYARRSREPHSTPVGEPEVPVMAYETYLATLHLAQNGVPITPASIAKTLHLSLPSARRRLARCERYALLQRLTLPGQPGVYLPTAR